MKDYQNSDNELSCCKNLFTKYLQKKIAFAGLIVWYVFLVWLFVIIPTQYTMLGDNAGAFADTFVSLSD